MKALRTLKTRKIYSSEKYGVEAAMRKEIISKKPLSAYYQKEDGVAYYEGCDFLGYMQNGDSFLFSQGMGFVKGKDKRVILCLSRHFLEKALKAHPDKISWKEALKLTSAAATTR